MPRAHQRHKVALEFPFLRFFTCDMEMVKASLTFDLLPSGPSYLPHLSVLTSHRELSALHFPAAATWLSLVPCLACLQVIRCHLLQVAVPNPELDRTLPPQSRRHTSSAFSLP